MLLCAQGRHTLRDKGARGKGTAGVEINVGTLLLDTIRDAKACASMTGRRRVNPEFGHVFGGI